MENNTYKGRPYIDIGTFTMETSDMRVSDPCFHKWDDSGGVIHNCIPGTWHVAVRYTKRGKVQKLVARHESVRSFLAAKDVVLSEDSICVTLPWDYAGFYVEVVSGKAGLFDDKYYYRDKSVKSLPAPKAEKKSLFYAHCCDAADLEELAGVLPYGVVCRARWRPNSYITLARTTKTGRVNMVMIVF